MLQSIRGHGKLLDLVAEWHQRKLNASLKKACMLGSYKMAIMVIRTGANNFAQCIKEYTQKNRINHILAYLRLCQAAFEDDQTAIDILLESDEDKVSQHPRYASLVDFNTILLPLIDNGTLTITEPLHVALKASHVTTAGKILLCSSKQRSSGMVDWHGLELTELEPSWLKTMDSSTMQLLCLSFNSLKLIPSQICHFTNLVKLQVAFNQLTYVPSAIFQIPCLENVDLSYNSISALPEALLGKVSPSLHTLTLSNNMLCKFPEYFVGSELRCLDLSKNRFKVVPESVYGIKQLESLNMSNNGEIRFIPYELGGLKHLKVTSFDGLPYTFNVPNDSLMDFIKRRFKSMQTVSHFEVAVMGFSHYSQTLHNFHSSLLRSPLDCSVLKFDNPTRFLSLHHVFKLPNTLYVLLWDCHMGQDPDDLHRVLRHLSIHVPGAPIVVAACWKDHNSQLEVELEELVKTSLWKDLRETVHLQHLVLESEDAGEDIDLRRETMPHSFQALLETISTLSRSVKLTQFVPGSYYSCGKILAKKQLLFEAEVKCPMLSDDEFWGEISAMPTHDLSNKEELCKLVSYLHLVGRVLKVQGPTGSHSWYVFNRQWFCNVLGNILSRQGTQVVQSVFGVVHQEVLVDLLACPSFHLPLPNALQYMLNKEGIALALSSEKWLIPSMLAESADDSTNIEPDQYGIRRQYTFNLTPANFWSRLIVHLLMNMDKFVREVSDVGVSSSSSSAASPGLHRYNTLPRQGVVDWSYWKRGILCWQNACHLVYSIESLSTSTDPYQETIEVRVPNNLIGYRTMHRLSLVIDSLLKNWYPKVWSSMEIWVPCSYCIHTGVPDVPAISFQDCILAVSKGVGVKCSKHPEKITSITKIIPDLVQEDVSIDVFLPPGSVELNTSDTSTCIPPPTETVFKGTYNKHLVAVKPFPHRKLHGVSDEQTLLDQECPSLLQMWAEFEIFRHLQAAKSPFIIEVIGVCPDPLCLVFPFARWCSLDDVFHTRDVTLPHMVRMKMIFQLASALRVLQSYKIIHRNISLANLLVFSLSADDAVNIKLAGFSNACYSIFQGIAVGQYGAFPAPEMLLTTEGEYDERVDIFAFAFVAYEIITQTRMHVTSYVTLQDNQHISRPSLEPVRVRAPYLVLLISECWHPDRTKRPFASKVVQLLKQPLHVLTRDGQLIDKNHEFFAASARFTRAHNNFHSDLFVSSGQLMGARTSYLACESLPGLSFERSKQLPAEFVICMGCMGSQLWISFYGKAVRVYSTINMEFINEFTFNYHVVAIAISPTSVYLGLENGVLQVYNVTDSVPTEPSLTKIVNAGEEFKCIEAMEDSLVCATKNTIFCLHPDTLDIEEKWVLEFEAKNEIRSIAISRCNWNDKDSKEEGSDLMWVAFRRWEQILVMNPWTGQRYYCIDCSRVLGKPPEKVYVQSLRVVLDTVWVGLNTGHILVFASDYREPRLLTHLKVHREGVRQLLLLHPSYMGPTTVLSTSEIARSLRDPRSNLIADQQRVNFPDSVLVVTFGNGLDDPLYSVDKHGGVVRSTEEDSEEVTHDGLFAVILEGGSISRMVQVERNSDRSALPYMEDYSDVDEEDGLYALPPDASGIGLYDIPRNIPRNDTWSANTVLSPVHSNPKSENGNHYETIPSRGYVESLSTSASTADTVHSAKFHSPPPPLPPRDIPPSLAAGTPLTPDSATTKGNRSPLSSIFNSLYKSKSHKKASHASNGAATHTEAEATSDHKTTPLELSDEYEYLPNVRAQSYTLPNKPSTQPRRLTYNDTSRPEIEDSADDFEPYVRMDTLMSTQEANLRKTASKANRKAMAIKQQRRNELSGVPEEGDFMSREDFLGGQGVEARQGVSTMEARQGVSKMEAWLVRELDLAKPIKKVKPKVAEKPFKRYP